MIAVRFPLKHLQEKHVPVKTGMEPVFHPKMRLNKELEPHPDSIGIKKALAGVSMDRS
jgi:hypothetical protein